MKHAFWAFFFGRNIKKKKKMSNKTVLVSYQWCRSYGRNCAKM